MTWWHRSFGGPSRTVRRNLESDPRAVDLAAILGVNKNGDPRLTSCARRDSLTSREVVRASSGTPQGARTDAHRRPARIRETQGYKREEVAAMVAARSRDEHCTTMELSVLTAPNSTHLWVARSIRVTLSLRTRSSTSPISLMSSICSHFDSQRLNTSYCTDIGGLVMPPDRIRTTTDSAHELNRLRSQRPEPWRCEALVARCSRCMGLPRAAESVNDYSSVAVAEWEGP